MTQTNPVARVVGYVLGPPVEWVGRRVERRVRRATPDLPEPPVWFAPVAVGFGLVSAVVAQLVREKKEERSERERATPEPQATAERGTTTESDESDAEEIVEALETLEVEFPPAPEQGAVRAAYRERAIETHPDQGGDAESFKEVRAAWERLPERQELSGDGDDERGN